MIPEEFWAEVPQGVVVTVSGGVDSTYVALKFHERGLQPILLHNDTRLTMKDSRVTLRRLVDYTGFEYVVTRPEDNWYEVVKESFRAIPFAIDGNGKYQRRLMKCCDVLKKDPARKYYKTLPKETAIVLSYCPIESQNRRFRLLELRGEKTFTRHHTHFSLRQFLYPLRDAKFKRQRTIREKYCEKKLGIPVRGSGCRVCPVLLIHKMHDVDAKRWAGSRIFALKLGGIKFCGDTKRLDEYFNGANDIAQQ